MVPAIMEAVANTKSGCFFGAGMCKPTPRYTKGRAPMSLSQMT